MANITRRNAIRTLAGSTVLLQACNYKHCTTEELERGITGSLMFLGVTDSNATAELRRRKDARMEADIKAVQAGPTQWERAGTTTLTGGPSGVTGGLPPSSANLQPTADTARSFYILDSLGDATSDGRVFALDATEMGFALRGSVSLRAANLGGPSADLRHIALSPNGAQLIVSQAGAPAQWIYIDAGTLQFNRQMAPANVFPRRVVYSPDGRLAYALSSNLATDNTSQILSIQILDTTARTVAGSIPIPANSSVADLAITPDGGLVFGVGARLLHVIDVASRTYSDRFELLAPPNGGAIATGGAERIVMHPDGEQLYMLIRRLSLQNESDAAVAIVDIRTAAKTGEIPLRLSPGVTGSMLGISRTGRTLVAGFQRGTELQSFTTDPLVEIPPIVMPSNFGLAGLALA